MKLDFSRALLFPRERRRAGDVRETLAMDEAEVYWRDPAGEGARGSDLVRFERERWRSQAPPLRARATAQFVEPSEVA
jgi:hypothetical protein